ncbi:MAG: GDP-mannose-dependent alpha-mannosyltransferase [Syntrophaceae bacterium PtaB.Bin095]|nr:MAG: GDP-mannose-dependent alpha-mannosyltransferase [Syntrophaceae bacterium PtaB.Bin095]
MKPAEPIRIAVVIPKYGLVGGGEKLAAELTERTARQFPCEMHVFANRWQAGSGRIRFHRVPVIAFPKYLTTVSFAWFAQRQIAAMGFDLVHAHERVFSADIVSLHSVPHRFWVREVRGKRLLSLFDRATIHVERRMVLNEKTIFLPVSGITRDRFVAEYPHCSGRTEVLHPGVDAAAFDASDRDRCRREIRGQTEWREEDTVLLFVGMNFELKGLDPLITAAGRAKAAAPGKPLKLLVVGKGNESRYRSLARSAGIGDDVHFTGVRRERMEDLYLASDFYAMLSSFDTFGMTVLEAMAASLPVIVSPGVGARDLVREGVNGFIVPREDIDAITARILLLMDRGKRREMGAAAREVAQAHTWDAMAQRITKLYEEILAAKSC